MIGTQNPTPLLHVACDGSFTSAEHHRILQYMLWPLWVLWFLWLLGLLWTLWFLWPVCNLALGSWRLSPCIHVFKISHLLFLAEYLDRWCWILLWTTESLAIAEYHRMCCLFHCYHLALLIAPAWPTQECKTMSAEPPCIAEYRSYIDRPFRILGIETDSAFETNSGNN